jgi:hypothetical protein
MNKITTIVTLKLPLNWKDFSGQSFKGNNK